MPSHHYIWQLTAKYTTLVIGFIPESTLLANGVTQAELDNGTFVVTTMYIKPSGDSAFTSTTGYKVNIPFTMLSKANFGANGLIN